MTVRSEMADPAWVIASYKWLLRAVCEIAVDPRDNTSAYIHRNNFITG